MKNIFSIVTRSIFVIFVISVLINFYIIGKTTNRNFSNIDDVPRKEITLLLGTSKYYKGKKQNAFFENRIQAAAKLFLEGKTSYIITSGDGSNNEAKYMKNDLISLGVPSEVIYADSNGYSTKDSIFRAKEVFGLNDIIIVSQKFHNQRALFLADFFKLKAIAYNAKDVQYSGFFVSIRDFFAKVKSVYDVFFFKKVVEKRIDLKKVFKLQKDESKNLDSLNENGR